PASPASRMSSASVSSPAAVPERPCVWLPPGARRRMRGIGAPSVVASKDHVSWLAPPERRRSPAMPVALGILRRTASARGAAIGFASVLISAPDADRLAVDDLIEILGKTVPHHAVAPIFGHTFGDAGVKLAPVRR